jgi:hypothetical protein
MDKHTKVNVINLDNGFSTTYLSERESKKVLGTVEGNNDAEKLVTLAVSATDSVSDNLDNPSPIALYEMLQLLANQRTKLMANNASYELIDDNKKIEQLMKQFHRKFFPFWNKHNGITVREG